MPADGALIRLTRQQSPFGLILSARVKEEAGELIGGDGGQRAEEVAAALIDALLAVVGPRGIGTSRPGG